MLLDESVVEQGVEIGEPVKGVFLVAAEVGVGFDEVAAAKVFQDFGEGSAVGYLRGLCSRRKDGGIRPTERLVA